ncbi:PucR family transcriptional regulator [Streptomyces roseicoloratus]|uniref:PucR family transcriptional regulator n=1 Tax=Streptomyces roseicoloratus TaxID=2508722 RepID=UPI001009EE40|nr:helix-turn-helix domain-containing protein [Streptomyces roseicoloratus]
MTVDLATTDQRPDAGRTAAAAVAAHLRADIARLAARATAEIIQQIDGFRRADLPRADLDAHVRFFLEAGIRALGEGRTAATDAEREAARAYGARRAADAVPAEDVLLSFYVAFRTVWEVTGDALAQRDDLGDLLPAMERTMLWVQYVTSEVGAGHREAQAGASTARLAAGRRLAEALDDPAVPESELHTALERLGFDPEGDFQLWVSRRDADAVRLRTVQARLEEAAGRFAVLGVSGEIVVVGQGGQATSPAEAALLADGGGPVGAGLVRSGPAGARRSVDDARRALRAGGGRPGVHRYADVWPFALVADVGAGRVPLLDEALDTARSNPHLAEAVREFADQGFSVAAAARALSVHANTLTYRLDRWHELTGLDCRTYAGLFTSRAAVELA